MHVCLTHIRHAHAGVTELYLNALAAHLCDSGHEVTIVCGSHDTPPHPRVRFVVLRDFAMTKSWRIWAFARSVKRHVNRTPYDVVMALGQTWSQDVIRLGGGSHKTFLESMGRHAARLRFKDWIALLIERRALAPNACRRVIVNSQMARRDVMARYGVPDEKIAVIYNGVDIERFHPRNRVAGAEIRRAAGFGRENPVFLFLGGGYRRKGLDLLLQAFRLVAEAQPQARLLVAGHDSDIDSYRRLAGQLGCGDKVQFLGARSDPELCFAASDVYVLPTRYDPFANSTLEALATGVPVVSTDGNGGAELIEEGVQGSVVPVSSGVQGLSATLLRWCDANRVRAASDAARRLAEQHNSVSKMRAAEQVLCEVARD